MKRLAYPGLADQKRDIEARCKILMDAIEVANASTKIDRVAKKICAAPEFFFSAIPLAVRAHAASDCP
jgi:hypothetical protein